MSNLPYVVETFIHAYNSKDVAGMLACLSDRVSFRNITDGEVTAEASGKQDFETMAKFAASAFETRHQKVLTAITVSDTTLVEIAYSAVVSIDLPNGWKAGQKLTFSGASMYRVDDEKIYDIVDQS